MFSPLVRFILLILCAGLSILGAYMNFWPIFFFTFIGSIGLLWGYYKSGTVPLALLRLRKNEFDACEKLIDQVQKPELLTKKNQAYYYFINGLLTHEKDKFAEAKAFLHQALDFEKLREPDEAMAYLALADMEMVQHHEDKARELFLKIKGMKVYPSMMEDVKKMQEWLRV